MDKPALLAEFQEQLDKLDQYQTFIEKARNMAGKFNPAVVEKVVTDNTEKSEVVYGIIAPLVPQVHEVIAQLESDKADVAGGVEDAKLSLEELELRVAIGELDQAAFEQEAAEAQGQVEGADAAIAAIDEELTSFRDLMNAWLERAPADDAPTSGPSEEEEDLLGSLEDDEDDGFLGDAFDEDDAFAGEQGRGSNVHAEKSDISDDISAVFDDEPEDEPLLAAPEDEGFVLPADDDLLDIAEAEVAGQDAAVLVLSEGTADETAFSFDGEVISLGRNRDNTIQVKNDSKVSRYHCKVYKRDGYYFIEDNKSANGTLVDGQLVTEKRLLGGEEIIVGETMFRFRIPA